MNEYPSLASLTMQCGPGPKRTIPQGQGSELESPMDHDSRSTTDSVGDNRRTVCILDSLISHRELKRAKGFARHSQMQSRLRRNWRRPVRTNKGWWGALRGRVLGLSATPEQLSLESFVSHALSRGTPTQMAKVLQLVARTVDEEHLERILLLIERLVLVDDEYMGTMEGLECAYLQGNLYSDIGQARRAWLTYRRAMTFAEICGLHRQRVNTWQDMLWWGLYAADRFSSLIIGAPYSVPDSHCRPDIWRKEAAFGAFNADNYLFCLPAGHHEWKSN